MQQERAQRQSAEAQAKRYAQQVINFEYSSQFKLTC